MFSDGVALLNNTLTCSREGSLAAFSIVVVLKAFVRNSSVFWSASSVFADGKVIFIADGMLVLIV